MTEQKAEPMEEEEATEEGGMLANLSPMALADFLGLPWPHPTPEYPQAPKSPPDPPPELPPGFRKSRKPV